MCVDLQKGCFSHAGGGMTEAARAAELTRQFGVPIAAQQVLLGHSPFMSLSHRFDCFCFTLLFSHALYSKCFLLLLVFLIW
jgi:hypothetical protein